MTKPKLSKLPWKLKYNIYVVCPKCKACHKVEQMLVLDAEQKCD